MDDSVGDEVGKPVCIRDLCTTSASVPNQEDASQSSGQVEKMPSLMVLAAAAAAIRKGGAQREGWNKLAYTPSA